MPVVRLMLHFHGSINLSSSFDMLHSLPPSPRLAFCCHLFNICVVASRRECAAYLSVIHNIQSATEHKGDSQHFIPNTTVYISVSGSFLNAIFFTPQMLRSSWSGIHYNIYCNWLKMKRTKKRSGKFSGPPIDPESSKILLCSLHTKGEGKK